MKKRWRDDPEWKKERCLWLSKRKARRRHWLNLYKKRKGCFRCGYNEHPVAMDFHHSNRLEKHLEISDLFGYKLKTLMNEVRKCLVVCSNCHRVLHMEEKNGI